MKIKGVIIGILAGVVAFSAPAISYAEVTINNVMNRVVHTENYMLLKEGVTDVIHGRVFTDTSEDGDSIITYDDLEDNESLLDQDGGIILNDQIIPQEDITAQQRELLEYFQNMLKNSQTGSKYFTPVETDQYGEWFDNMLAMVGNKQDEWMNSMVNGLDYNSSSFRLPSVTDTNALYKTYAKNLALTKNEWYNLLNKFASSGSLGFGSNVWNNGGNGIGTNLNVDPNYSGFDTSAVKKYDISKAMSDYEKEFNKMADEMRGMFENSQLTIDVQRLIAAIVPANRAWWEYVGMFFASLGKSAALIVSAPFSDTAFQSTAAEEKRKEIQKDLDYRYKMAVQKEKEKHINLIESTIQVKQNKELENLINEYVNKSEKMLSIRKDLISNDKNRNNLIMQHEQAATDAGQAFENLYNFFEEGAKKEYEHQASNNYTATQFEQNARAMKNWYAEEGLLPGGPVSAITWGAEDKISEWYAKQNSVGEAFKSLIGGDGDNDLIVQWLDSLTGAKNPETWSEYTQRVGNESNQAGKELDNAIATYGQRITNGMNNIWHDFLHKEEVQVHSAIDLPSKDAATPDALKDKFNNATNEQKQAFNDYKNAWENSKNAQEQALLAQANGDSDLEAEWYKYKDANDKIAQMALDKLYDSIGYDNFDIPQEYVDLINNIYGNMDENYRLKALSLENEMLEIAKILKAKNAEYVNKAELEKRMNSVFSNKNVTAFNYQAFLNDYNRVHSKMSNIGAEYAPIAFNYFNNTSGWSDYRNYVDRLLFGDQYGLKDLGGLNSFYNNGNMALTVIKEKVLRQVTENITYYGHFNQDFLWRIDDSNGKEVGVYETDVPELYITGGSPDTYFVTENQRADVYLVTARTYGVRYYVFNPATNTVLAAWEEKDVEVTPQPNTASTRWVKVWTLTYQTTKNKSKGVKRNSDLWDTQQIQ